MADESCPTLLVVLPDYCVCCIVGAAQLRLEGWPERRSAPLTSRHSIHLDSPFLPKRGLDHLAGSVVALELLDPFGSHSFGERAQYFLPNIFAPMSPLSAMNSSGLMESLEIGESRTRKASACSLRKETWKSVESPPPSFAVGFGRASPPSYASSRIREPISASDITFA